MNTRVKGNRSRRRAIEYYTSQGWLIDIVEKTGKWIVNKDLFSEACGIGFDLVGIKHNQVLFVQVKTNVAPQKKEYAQFANKYAGENLLVEMFVWHDFRGIVIYEFYSNGSIQERDLRWQNKTVKKKKSLHSVKKH